MPSSNKPPSSNPSAKKQQSIASFFTPGGAAGVSKPPTVDAKTVQAENEGTTSHLNGNGAILGRDKRRDIVREEEDELPVRKRQKSGQGAAVNGNISGVQPIEQGSHFDNQADFGTQDGTISRGGLSAAAAKGPRHGRKISERTSKYLFNNSPGQSRTQEGHNDESDLSEGERQEKAKRHRDFVRKLGKPESFADLRRRNFIIPDEVAEEVPNEADDMADGDAEGQAPEGKNRKAPRKGSGAKSLTPMEKQVLEIKAKHKDTLLIVEVGYKFRFFGEDARIAAKELRIVCIPGKMRFDEHISEAHLDRFASASIPVHRLHVHVKRLVTAGYKVGVVRQLETAALKAAGDNKGGPFIRKLTNVYTKGTYIDDIEGLDEPLDSPKGGAPATGYLLSITETKAKGWGNDEKVHVGIVAVQPATGDVIYDDFEDGFMRSEIETRILHIAPCEFLIVGELSKATSKLIEHLSGSSMNVFGDKIRVERVPKGKTMAAESYSHLANFYAGKLKESHGQADESPGRLLDKVLNLAEHVTICLSAMIKHMSEYGLEHVFDLTKYFQSFSARSHMLLNGNTLTSLEIYLNQTDKSEKGSLFWSLDRTRTRFGQRLLRRWVGRPLLEKARLVERIKAVEELTESQSIMLVDRLKNLLSSVKSDLEKSLIRIYYGKCSRPELLTVLQTLQRISNAFATVKSPSEAGFRSDIINHAVATLPTIASIVTNHLDKINSGAARSDDKYNFFLEAEENSAITKRKEAIHSIEEQLDEHRLEAAKKVGLKQAEYVTVAGIEYLIELENTQTKKIPASWAKISGTKKVSRWHTPEVIRLLREREQNKEALAAACDLAFRSLLAEIAEDYQSFRDCVQSLATLDCLLSLSVIASQPGYVKPEYVDDTLIEVKAGRHPMVEQLLLDSYVPNDINLSSRNTRALLITGPNMGGKSSYVRQVALITIMGQIGSYVPADSAKLGMFDAVFTRMGAFDNMMAGESTFMVELSETSDILKQATPRSLVILDELGRGTSTHDGVAIAEGVLDYTVRDLKCVTLFITHYQTLSTVANGYENDELKNVHMRFTEGGQDGQDITFLYEVGEGVAHRSYGLNVARLAKVPKSVLDTAAVKSKELEDVIQVKKLTSLSRNILAVLHSGDMDQLELLAKGIEQL